MNRHEAKELGLTRYEGTPCKKYGHTLRITRSGGCYYCWKEAAKSWVDKNKERVSIGHNKWQREYKYNHSKEQYMHRVYIQQKNQATFRKEDWDFLFVNWSRMWEDSGKWERKGRKGHQYSMMRLSKDKAWCKDNCKIMIRSKQLAVTEKLKDIYKIQTPLGIFHSQREACAAHKISTDKMRSLRMTYPDQYYYIGDKKCQ